MARTKGAKDKKPRKNSGGHTGRPKEAPVRIKGPRRNPNPPPPLPPSKGPVPGQTVAWAKVVRQISSMPASEIKLLPTDTAKEVAVKSAVVSAMKGNLRALEWLANREDGSPKQDVELSGKIQSEAISPLAIEKAIEAARAAEEAGEV